MLLGGGFYNWWRVLDFKLEIMIRRMGSHEVIEDFRLENGLKCFLGPDCTT